MKRLNYQKLEYKYRDAVRYHDTNYSAYGGHMTRKKLRQITEYCPYLLKNKTSKRWLGRSKNRQAFILADGYTVEYYFSIEHFTWNASLWITTGPDQITLVKEIAAVDRKELTGKIRLYLAAHKNPSVWSVVQRMSGVKSATREDKEVGLWEL